MQLCFLTILNFWHVKKIRGLELNFEEKIVCNVVDCVDSLLNLLLQFFMIIFTFKLCTQLSNILGNITSFILIMFVFVYKFSWYEFSKCMFLLCVLIILSLVCYSSTNYSYVTPATRQAKPCGSP